MNKKGFILLASIFLVLFLGIFLGISLMRADLQLRSMEYRRASLYAFYAAEAGIDEAVFELRKNLNWNAGFTNRSLVWQMPDQVSETVGDYTVTVASALLIGNVPSVWVRSEGRNNPVGSQVQITRVIFARIALMTPADFFASTPGDLRLFSNLNMTGSVYGRKIIFDVDYSRKHDERFIRVTRNVNYDNVQGGYTYYPTSPPSGQPAVQTYVNVGGLTPVDPITYVGLDLATYKDIAQNQGGKYILNPDDGDADTYEHAFECCSGDINWQNPNITTYNGLVYIDGDLRIKGHVTESIHFIASGDIYIDDNITSDPDLVTGLEPQIGLSSAKDVFINSIAPSNRLEIDAYIMADGGVFTAKGGANTKQDLIVEGVVVVRGREGVTSSIALNVYRNRIYTHDAQLRTSMNIPYLTHPYVRVYSWKEVKPTDQFPPP